MVSISEFQKLIMDHYRRHGRKDLPWKKTRDPYKILVSEVMLQQTQVSRVLPKYHEFLKAFPTVQALAKAPSAKLLKTWQGLGYWRRAKYLKAAAQMINTDPTLSKLFGVKSEPRRPNFGDLARGAGLPSSSPAKQDEQRMSGRSQNSDRLEASNLLEQLPGVGPYTARAVACFAFNHLEPFIDTNIRRVYLHFFFADQKNISDKEILKIAERTICTKDPRTWHYALFDYGATVLKDKKINRRSRHYAKQPQFEGSFRSLRTSAVQLLLQQPKHVISQAKLQQFLQEKIRTQATAYTPKQVISALLKDKLVKQTAGSYSL